MRWLDRLARKPTEVPVAERLATALEAAKRGDHAAALHIWKPLAQAGVARAQNNIGACFAEGLGVDRDPELAFRWLMLAAASNDPVGRGIWLRFIFAARESNRTMDVLPNSIGRLRSRGTDRHRIC